VSYVRNPSSLATTRRNYLHRILLKNVLQTHNIILLLLYGRVVIARALMRCLLSMIVDRTASFRITFPVLYILYNIYYLIVRQAYTLYLQSMNLLRLKCIQKIYIYMYIGIIHKLLSEEDTVENMGKLNVHRVYYDIIIIFVYSYKSIGSNQYVCVGVLFAASRNPRLG